MSKGERDEVLGELASRIFAAMVEDAVMDVALQSHHEVARSRAVCHICHTRCGSAHAAQPPQGAPQSPRQATPEDAAKAGAKADGGAGALLECVNCKRSIAHNRYAPHLSSCMGLSTGARRAAPRGLQNKSKTASDAGRSVSPNGSENGHVSEDERAGKARAKSKTKRADEAEFNLKRKRPNSPQISPHKAKKPKVSGSPVSRIKADPDGSTSPPLKPRPLPPTGAHSKLPSKLRAASTASFAGRTSSSRSRSSSPGTPIAALSTPTSTVSAPSPRLAGGRGRGKKGAPPPPPPGALQPPPPPRRASPPRPPPPPVKLPEPDYLIDVDDGGDETGSSTDTDSS